MKLNKPVWWKDSRGDWQEGVLLLFAKGPEASILWRGRKIFVPKIFLTSQRPDELKLRDEPKVSSPPSPPPSSPT